MAKELIIRLRRVLSFGRAKNNSLQIGTTADNEPLEGGIVVTEDEIKLTPKTTTQAKPRAKRLTKKEKEAADKAKAAEEQAADEARLAAKIERKVLEANAAKTMSEAVKKLADAETQTLENATEVETAKLIREQARALALENEEKRIALNKKRREERKTEWQERRKAWKVGISNRWDRFKNLFKRQPNPAAGVQGPWRAKFTASKARSAATRLWAGLKVLGKALWKAIKAFFRALSKIPVLWGGREGFARKRQAFKVWWHKAPPTPIAEESPRPAETEQTVQAQAEDDDWKRRFERPDLHDALKVTEEDIQRSLPRSMRRESAHAPGTATNRRIH